MGVWIWIAVRSEYSRGYESTLDCRKCSEVQSTYSIDCFSRACAVGRIFKLFPNWLFAEGRQMYCTFCTYSVVVALSLMPASPHMIANVNGH